MDGSFPDRARSQQPFSEIASIFAASRTLTSSGCGLEGTVSMAVSIHFIFEFSLLRSDAVAFGVTSAVATRKSLEAAPYHGKNERQTPPTKIFCHFSVA